MSRGDEYDYDRDRYDDDRDRPGGRDREQYEDYDGDSPAARRRRAEGRVKLAAVVMLVIALLCLAFNVGYIALLWINPEPVLRSNYDLMKQLFPNQSQPPFEEFVKQAQVQQSVIYGIRIVLAIVIAAGAMKMRALQGYGLAMAASIIALIPFCPNECCCTLPFGVWSLVVLLQSDVKRAFQMTAAESYQ